MSFEESELTNTELDASLGSEQSTRPVINRTVAKPAKGRKTKPKAIKRTNAKTKAEREALRNVTNIKADARDESELVQDGDDHDDLDNHTKPVSKKAKSRRHADQDAADDAPVRKKQRLQDDASDRKSARSKATHKTTPTIPETQDVIDPSELSIQSPQEEKKKGRRVIERARSASVQRQLPARAPSASRQFSRERSASDNNRRLADSDAKRKLNEVTAKYDDTKLRYEQLAELGRESAESNFDKLKTATDDRARIAADLIASLRQELSDARRSHTLATTELARQQSHVAAQQAEIEKLRAEHKTDQNALLASQNEVKSLNAKLEATRKSAATDMARTPAVKESSTRIGLGAGSKLSAVSGLDASNEAYLKEELYRDLTGLIINSVKRKDDENEFSCIQTGRNGTLHFHLKVSTEDPSTSNPKTPSAGNNATTSYDETTFAYEPFLDEDRDRELMDILPDYLIEEIDFPRSMATKFHFRLVEKMTAKIELED